VLVTGMTIGTLFTLFVVPSIYMLLARNHSLKRETEAEEASQQGDLERFAEPVSIHRDILRPTAPGTPLIEGASQP